MVHTMEDTIQIIRASTEELLQRLEVMAEVSVTEQDDIFFVQIETEEAGILIGYHGRNLESLQLLLGQIAFKKLGEWKRINLSVGDYREKREKQLQELALSTASRVEQTQTPTVLSQLTPAERRIVHMVLQDHPTVISESEGEGRSRQLVVKPRV